MTLHLVRLIRSPGPRPCPKIKPIPCSCACTGPFGASRRSYAVNKHINTRWCISMPFIFIQTNDSRSHVNTQPRCIRGTSVCSDIKSCVSCATYAVSRVYEYACVLHAPAWKRACDFCGVCRVCSIRGYMEARSVARYLGLVRSFSRSSRALLEGDYGTGHLFDKNSRWPAPIEPADFARASETSETVIRRHSLETTRL